MKSIGVRELRQNASEHLRLVQLGATIEITDRGRPVAMLVPIAADISQLALLETQGRLSPDAGDLLELGAPLKPVVGRASASDELARMRAAER
jgi:prevent-host-death family protein